MFIHTVVCIHFHSKCVSNRYVSKCQRVLTYFIYHYPQCLTNSKDTLQQVTPIYLIVIRVFGIYALASLSMCCAYCLCRRANAFPSLYFCNRVFQFNWFCCKFQSEYQRIEYNTHIVEIIAEHKSFGWCNCNTSGFPQNEQANKQTEKKKKKSRRRCVTRTTHSNSSIMYG